MKRLNLLPVDSPLIEIECGGKVKRMKHSIKSIKKHPNFPDPIMTTDIVSYNYIGKYFHHTIII